MNVDFDMRRQILKVAAACASTGMLANLLPLSRADAADNPSPLVDARFPVEIADSIWIIPDRRIPLVPNIGIVLGKDTALVIDSGLGQESGRRALDAARRIAGQRRIILTTTHGHPEHTTGAASFGSDIDYIANEQQVAYLKRTGLAFVDQFRRIGGDNVVRLLSGVELRIPRSVYQNGTYMLDLGGRVVQFRTWGTAHSPGDQIVYVPDAKLLFAGDLIEERMFPIVPFFPPTVSAQDIDVSRWVQILQDFRQLDVLIVVPGHGNLGGLEIADNLANYFIADEKEVSDLRQAGLEGDELLRKTRDYLLDQYPTWEQSSRIDAATRYLAQRT